jgi:hypothetical protein
MNGPIAQIVALTCHANAFLRGLPIPAFFPGNSTCQFCDWVKFVTVSKTIFGKARETPVADHPNDWFQHLKTAEILGVRLSCAPQNNPGISDRMSSAFVGGGGSWAMEAFQERAKSAFWLSRWQVWNQNAPERRIWRVDYGRVSEASPRAAGNASLELAQNRFRSALAEIHAFSEKHGCGGFTACFSRAMETLDSDGVKRHGYHKDLVVDGVVPSLAEGLLDAAQSAWVFGGMGSWNDMGFEGDDQADYDRVSQQLFAVLNETIQIAANASCASRAT